MGETLMPVDDARVLKEAEILVLRSMQDAIKGIREDTAAIRDQVQDVRERMIVVETQKTDAKVVALAARVDVLEDDKQRQQGAASVIGWLAKNWQTVGLFVISLYMLWRYGAALPHP